MRKGDFVRIEAKNGTLGEGYWVAGRLLADAEVGRRLEMWRVCRNGVHLPGFFTTSPLTELMENTFRTENSEYEWDFENSEFYMDRRGEGA